MNSIQIQDLEEKKIYPNLMLSLLHTRLLVMNTNITPLMETHQNKDKNRCFNITSKE